MGIPFTGGMGFLFTATMGNLFTMILEIQLTISSFALKAPKIRVKVTVLAKIN